MSQQPVVLQKIDWYDLCPWTIIFRTLSVACNPAILAIALLGTLLNPLGWIISQNLFLGPPHPSDIEFNETVELNASAYKGLFRESAVENGFEILGIRINGPHLIFKQAVRRFGALIYQESSETDVTAGYQWSKKTYFLTGNIWSIVVWSFFGLAIARICLIRLARNEVVKMEEAFSFARKKWLAVVGAIGLPLFGIVLLCVPAMIAGIIMTVDVGVLLIGAVWCFVLLVSFGVVLFLLGLTLGWPLMIGAVAAEGQNSFDAMTRAYAYTFQRPLNYLFYVFLAILYGGFCWFIVALITEGVIDVAFWSASLGTSWGGADRINVIQGFSLENTMDDSLTRDWGSGLIQLWIAFARTVAVAFIYGLFWCQASAIYLLLRRDVDELEMDEIFIEDEQRLFHLPELATDDQGVPQIKPLENGDNDDDRAATPSD